MARQTEVMPKFGRFLIAESSETVQTGAYSGSQWGAFWWTMCLVVFVPVKLGFNATSLYGIVYYDMARQNIVYDKKKAVKIWCVVQGFVASTGLSCRQGVKLGEGCSLKRIHEP